MRLLSLLVPVFASALVFSFNVPRQSNSSGLTGGATCFKVMCIIATVNDTDVQYVLQSSGTSALGWMAMGFGSTMANTPMVIMWSNNDGSVTLSQRMARSEVMPTVQASPSRVASILQSDINLSGNKPQLAFSVPKNSDTVQKIIWAYSTTNPGSAAVDATISKHTDSGSTTVDLTQPISSANPTPTPIVQSDAGGSLTTYHRMVIAHAILCVVGFLFLLPLGALVGRYLRTLTNTWFTGHWFIQVTLAGPFIVSGIALGIAAVSKTGPDHFTDVHTRLGAALFVLYVFQCTFGWIVHKFKPASHTIRRPYQNYAHAIMGLLIIALSMYQVRTGYKTEWPDATGEEPLPRGVNILWIFWIAMLSVLYFAGLALLPRQFGQEDLRRSVSKAS